MKIRITVDVSDWFEDRVHELKTERYSSYKLIALGNNMVWTLLCCNDKGIEVERFTLAPTGIESMEKIIEKLKITDIKENIYCKI